MNPTDDRKRMITSPANARVRQVILYRKKRKERDRDSVFVAEGERLVTEAPDGELLQLYVSASYHAAMNRDAKRFFARHEKNAQIVSDDVFAKMSDTKTPQGILAVVRQRKLTLADALKLSFNGSIEETGGGIDDPAAGQRAGSVAATVPVLENIQDPGNLGTILRSSEAAGTPFVILTGDTADRHAPKAVRATMGSIFRVPVVFADMTEIAAQLQAAGFCIAAADASGKTAYDRYDWNKKNALIIGNEANGLSAEAKAAADVLLRIPMAGKNESLNAAVSASVLLFEAARQRRISMI